MVELNSMFRLTRIVVFATTSFFAFIVIILGGLVTNYDNNLFDGFFVFSFAALGIATGVFTLLTLPVMLALSMFRKGLFTSMIAVEIAWTWILWILWIAVGGNSATGLAIVGSCSQYVPSAAAACNESSGIAALGFLSWIMLLGYCSFLATLTFRQHMRGNTGIWTKDVTETDFTAVGANTTQIVFDNKSSSATYPNQYPPAGTPIQQQTPGSYTQAGLPYQQGSPYPQPQAPGLYNQPQAAGSFTQQSKAGSPYPQV
jgi:hypothetical protein